MDPHDPWTKHIYLLFASIAGGITSLSIQRWQEMRTPEIILAIFAGASFAYFFVPWVAERYVGVPQEDLRGLAALCYIGATGANVLLPVLIQRLKNLARGSDKTGGEPT